MRAGLQLSCPSAIHDEHMPGDKLGADEIQHRFDTHLAASRAGRAAWTGRSVSHRSSVQPSGLSTGPGAMALTRTVGASASAVALRQHDRRRLWRRCDAHSAATACSPASSAMLMMTPPPCACASIIRPACWLNRNGPVRLMPRVASQSCGVMSRNGFCCMMAALLTRMSNRPHLRLQRVEHGGHLRRVGLVAADGQSPYPTRFDLGDGLLRFVRRGVIGDGDVRALARQRQRNRACPRGALRPSPARLGHECPSGNSPTSSESVHRTSDIIPVSAWGIGHQHKNWRNSIPPVPTSDLQPRPPIYGLKKLDSMNQIFAGRSARRRMK